MPCPGAGFKRDKNMKTITFCRFRICLIAIVLGLSGCSSPEEKAAAYIESAGRLVDDGKLEQAELEYRNALQINQNLPEALYGLATIYDRKRQWQKTYAILNQLGELAPRHIEGRIMLARLLLASNQLDQALADARELTEIAADNAQTHSLLGSVLAMLDSHDAALDAAEKSLEIEPGNSNALLVKARVFLSRKEYERLLHMLDEAIERTPDEVSFYLMQIQAYEALGKRNAIEGVYRELVERFPGNTAYRNALARHFLLDKNVDAAEEVLAKAADSDSDNIAQRLRLVAFKYQNRSTDDAIALVRRYIREDGGEYAYRLLLGELYERSEDFDKATSVYRQIVADDKLQPNGLEARNRLARIAMRQGKSGAAAALVDEVLEREAANNNALLLRARLRVEANSYDDALIDIRRVLRDNPDSARALELLGRVYSALGSRELAIESFRNALDLKPGSPAIVYHLARLLYEQGDFAQADDILLESVARGNRSLPSIKLLAQVKLAQGQWDEAELLLQELNSVKGMEALSQQTLGMLYQATDDQPASIAAFRRAHELAPTSARPMVALVTAYLRNGQKNEARQFLQSVTDAGEDNAVAQLLLARLSRDENDFESAIAMYKKTIRIDPGIGRSYHELAEIYVLQKNFAAAEDIVLQGLAALPDDPLLVVDLASIQLLRGAVDQAIATYQAVLDRNPEQLVIRNNLASLLTDHGDTANREAARAIAQQLKLSPLAQFRDTWAWASIRAGADMEQAIAILEDIVDENRQIAVYVYHLGEAHRLQGNSQSARNHLKRALELAGTESPVAEKARDSLKQLDQQNSD